MNFAGLDPIRALYWSAIVNGIVAAPLVAMLMIMSASRAVAWEFTLPLDLRIGDDDARYVAPSLAFLASLARSTRSRRATFTAKWYISAHV